MKCLPSSVGEPNANGLVPKSALFPFHGAIAEGVFPNTIDIIPCSAAFSAI